MKRIGQKKQWKRNNPKETRNQHAKQTNIDKETILGNAVQSRLQQQEESGYSTCENVFISSAFETVRNRFWNG